ncbi:MAG: hypothetical protein JW966_05910 [Anaerolineae bacterium]|nr:hypothetical protein [Anaerolineae bacterium]
MIVRRFAPHPGRLQQKRTRVRARTRARVIAISFTTGVIILAGMGHAGIPSQPVVAQDDTRTLTLLEPVRGAINDTTPFEDWTFDGQADQVISIRVTAVGGNLDPAFQVIGPGDSVIAENDDIDSLVNDAGIEALTLPGDGTYTVRVTRFKGSSGTTTGKYELTVTPGFARVVHAEPFEDDESAWALISSDTISVENETLRVEAPPDGGVTLALPPDAQSLDDMYIQATAQLAGETSYAEFGLVFRGRGSLAAGQGGWQGYQFKINTEGKWTVVLQDATGEYTLRSWTTNPALNTSRWTLAVLVRGSSFVFYANGTRLGDLTDDRLPGPGLVALLVATRSDQPDSAAVRFDDLAVTTRQGTTYRGLPLALTTWETNEPEAITTELAESGQITLSAARDLFVPETILQAAEQTGKFDLLGTEQAAYTDFVLGGVIRIITPEGSDNGCGLVYRQQDEHNLDLVYVDTGGGFGVVQMRNSALITNVYDYSPMVQNVPNQLVIVAQAGRVALYINGALVTQEKVQSGEGRIGVSLLNYSAVETECAFLNVWVWPLEGN